MPKRRKSPSRSTGSKMPFFKRLADGNDNRTSTKLIRSGMDVGGALAGGLLGAAIGKNSALFGLGVLVTGNFMGDKTGLYKTIGASMLTYGIAKFLQESDTANKSVQGLSGTEGVKERIGKYKDELMSAFYLDKIFKKKSSGTTAARSAEEDDESVGALDLSALDFFEDYNHQQANEFEINQNYDRNALPDYSVSAAPFDDDDDDDETINFAIIDDMPDLNQM
nr:hypothetical protein [uncultured Fluviicola sp.]